MNPQASRAKGANGSIWLTPRQHPSLFKDVAKKSGWAGKKDCLECISGNKESQ